MNKQPIRAIQEAPRVEPLAGDILDPRRQRPIVVISTPMASHGDAIPEETWREAEEVHGAVSAFADVAIITTGPVSRRLEELLPPKWHIFGGGARSYPAGVREAPSIRRSPLRFRRRGETASEDLIVDAIRHARDAGVFDAPIKGARRIRGEVVGLVAGRAILKHDGGFATILGELVAPDVPIEWVLAPGDVLEGELDPATQQLRPEPTDGTLAEYLSAYPHTTVTLALVETVEPATATLLVRPGLRVTIRPSDVSSNPNDTLDMLLSAGDVLPVRVIHLSSGDLHLRLSDIDDDETVAPPPALIVGGSPWLAIDRRLVRELDALHEPATGPIDVVEPAAVPPRDEEVHTGPLPRPGKQPAVPLTADPVLVPPSSAESEHAPRRTALADTQLALAAAKSRIAALEQQLAEADADDGAIARLKLQTRLAQERWRAAETENRGLREQIARLREQQDKSQHALRTARRAERHPTGSAHRRQAWSSDEGWVRHEILLAWVDRVSASEKADYPLPDYRIGPAFAESLSDLTEEQFDKAMKAVVDALTDRAKDIPGRDLHPLRTGDSGNSPDRVRDDGQRCWRAAVEQDTPSARRLHYWQGAGAPIELSRIVLHDDTEP